MERLIQKIKTADKKKKAAWAAFIAAAVILIAAVILLAGGGKRLLSVVKHEGKTEVERENRSIDIYDGMRVESGDTVSTGEKSSVTMSLDKNKLVRVAELTKVTFEEIAGGKSDEVTAIYLEKGTLVNDIKEKLKDNASYEVSTPNATVSIRGTHFVVYVGEEQGYEGVVTKVNVYDGTVKVVNQAGEVMILYADKMQEDRTDSTVILPQGNRAVVGKEKIVVNEGVDYTGLNRDDFERLKEIAANEESVLKPEEIERMQSELLEETAAFGESGDGAADSGSLVSPPTGQTEPGESDSGSGGRTADEILEALGVEPLPGNTSGEGELAKLPDTGESGLLPLPPSGSYPENPATDNNGQAGDNNSSSSGNQNNNANTEDGGSSGGNTPDEGGSSGGNTPDEGGSSGGNTPDEGGGSEDNEPEINEAEAYAPALLAVADQAAIEEKIATLEERITALKAIATPDRADEIAACEEAVKTAGNLLDEVKEVNDVLTLINNLPMPSQIAAADKTSIEQARQQYNSLNAEQKGIVPERSLQKLEACEKKF